jgi:hypothetical protein
LQSERNNRGVQRDPRCFRRRRRVPDPRRQTFLVG